MFLIHAMAARLGTTMTDVCKSGELWWSRPDGKIQVIITKYEQRLHCKALTLIVTSRLLVYQIDVYSSTWVPQASSVEVFAQPSK